MMLELFSGELTAAVGRVYLRLRGGGGAWRLTGTVRGPFAEGTRTLPATVAFRELGVRDGARWWEAVVPDPCPWTPQSPLSYRVSAELRDGDRVVETVERRLGLRALGVRGTSLYLAGKRWVLRGVSATSVDGIDWPMWREQHASLYCTAADDATLTAASSQGTPVVVELGATADAGTIRRLASWPCVFVVVIPATAPLDLAGPEFRQVVVAHFADGTTPTPSWSQAAVVSLAALESQVRLTPAVPIFVRDPLPARQDFPAARRAVDDLQAQTAPQGDFAGFIV